MLLPQHGPLTQVNVDEVLGLMRHVADKMSSNDAVPCRVVLFVQFPFNIGLVGTVHCILLHFIRHVCILYHRLLL
uniref:Uncharacterized protein n=1 Tax=Sphaeramia orbicularis TaxID=375764 RepID=A0A673BA38_9TELE